MSFNTVIKPFFVARSERVKSVDLHPTNPWVAVALYSGSVNIWNMETKQLVQSIKVCDAPVRTARFVPRKNWIVTGSDDKCVRVFDYNTAECVHKFTAHDDFVRTLAVHPTAPFVLTGGDDKLIKLWNWEKNWECVQQFEGHENYVMQVAFNPKDDQEFASASLDKTIKVWKLDSPNPISTLEGHEKGVNCVSYFVNGEKANVLSGDDNGLVKIWNYRVDGKNDGVLTLEGHGHNVSRVLFHPDLPVIMSVSEDNTCRVWRLTDENSGLYGFERSVNYDLGRMWDVTCLGNSLVVGCDHGVVCMDVKQDGGEMLANKVEKPE